MSLWENPSGEPIEIGGLPVDCVSCPCEETGGNCAWILAICNTNAIADDQFDLILNGTNIGFFDGNDSACVGEVFVTDAAISMGDVPMPACCLSEMTLTVISDTLFSGASNTLFMENVGETGVNGSWGTVLLVRVCIVGGEVVGRNICSVQNYSGFPGDDINLNLGGCECSCEELPACCSDPNTPPAASFSFAGDDCGAITVTSTSTGGVCNDIQGEIVSCTYSYTINNQSEGIDAGIEVEGTNCEIVIDVLELLCLLPDDQPPCLPCDPGDCQVARNSICTCGENFITVTLTVTDSNGCQDTHTETYTCGCEITEVPSISIGDGEGCDGCPPDCCKEVTVTWPTTDSCGNELILLGDIGGDGFGGGAQPDLSCPCAEPGGASGGTQLFESLCVSEGSITGQLQLARANAPCCTGPVLVVDEEVSCGCSCCNGSVGGAIMTVTGIPATGTQEPPCTTCDNLNVTLDVPADPGNLCQGIGNTTALIECPGPSSDNATVNLAWSIVCDLEDPGYWLRITWSIVEPFSGAGASGDDFFFLGLDKPTCSTISECIEFLSDPTELGLCVYESVTVCAEFYAA